MTTLAYYQQLARQFAPHGEQGASARRWYDLHKARMARRTYQDPLPHTPGAFAQRSVANLSNSAR